MLIRPLKLDRPTASGFTIIELLIATTVFAVMLLLAQSIFVQIGHLFYRGVSISNTQETADHIFQDITGNFQNAVSVNSGSSSGYTYYCIGNTRYTYQTSTTKSVDSSAGTDHSAGGNYGILKDILPGGGGACEPPCDAGSCPNGALAFINPVELLGDNMRLGQFSISQSTTTSNLYNISIIIAYGDNNSLSYKTAGDPSTVYCQSDSQNNFCAVSNINTSVFKGIHQQ